MRKIFLIIIFNIFCFSYSSSAALISKKETSSDFIIAKINSKAITYSELVERYRYATILTRLSVKTSQEKNLLLIQILDKMIDEELIRQEAKNLGISVSDNELKDSIETIALNQKKNASQLKFSITGKGLSFDDFVRQVESEILWSKIVEQNLGSRIKVSESEVKELFEQEKFNVSVMKFLLYEIVISKDRALGGMAKSFSDNLVVELRGGADFIEMVKQFSSGFSAENGGEIGWVSQNDVDKKIYSELLKIKKGGYTDPILLSDGYHIFKMVDAKTEHKIKDQDFKAARNIIFSKKLQTAAKGYLIEMRKKAFVEIDKKGLQK